MSAPLRERWDEFRLHARQGFFTRKVEKARGIIAEALRHEGPWAAGASGGKDSTAMVRLLVDSGWRGPLVHISYPETPQENTELARGLAARWDLPLHVVGVRGAWDVYAEMGRFFDSPGTDEEAAAARAMLRDFGRAVDTLARREMWAGQFLGMRRAESRVRRMILGRKGAVYEVADRSTWTACPLADWTARDVWAYTATHDLPHLERYDAAADPEQERSEMTWLACERLWTEGMVARMRLERSAEFLDLSARFPDINRFT